MTPHGIRDILSFNSGHVTRIILNALSELLVARIINFDGGEMGITQKKNQSSLLIEEN